MKVDNKLLAVVVVLALAFYGGFLSLGAPASTGGAGVGAGGAGTGGVCPGLTSGFTQTVEPTAKNTYTNAVVTGAGHFLASNPEMTDLLGSNVTSPGSKYYSIAVVANYITSYKEFTTGCADSSPKVIFSMKPFDTSVSQTVYNANGVTENGISGTNEQAIGASGSTTMHIKMAQSAAYKGLSGVDGKWCVFINGTNVTDWAPSSFSASFDNVPGVFYTSGGLDNAATPSALTGTLIQGFVFNTDFAPNDGSLHDLAIKLQAASGINPGNQTLSAMFAPAQYYFNTQNNKLEVGCVKDSGAAIQALQGSSIQVK